MPILIFAGLLALTQVFFGVIHIIKSIRNAKKEHNRMRFRYSLMNAFSFTLAQTSWFVYFGLFKFFITIGLIPLIL